MNSGVTFAAVELQLSKSKLISFREELHLSGLNGTESHPDM